MRLAVFLEFPCRILTDPVAKRALIMNTLQFGSWQNFECFWLEGIPSDEARACMVQSSVHSVLICCLLKISLARRAAVRSGLSVSFCLVKW
jgi:hypothetical protein